MKRSGIISTLIALGAAILTIAAYPTNALASWSVQSSNSPTGAKASRLYGVSCVKSEYCKAVGSYVNSSGVQKVLAENNTSTPWEPELPPNPSGGTEPELFTISCPTTEFCMAVGRYKESGVPDALAEKWTSAHGWELQTLPFPLGNTASELGGVSCHSSSECVATGDFHNSTGEHNLAEYWNGSSWTAEEPPALSGAGYPALDAVSCPEAGKCLAVGEYRNSLGVELTQSAKWSGGSWATSIAMSHPTGASSMTGASVSCVTISECMAVGFYTSSGTIVSLGDEWEPVTPSWTVQTTKNVTGASATKLEGISCPTKVGECIATGASVTSGVSSALGEEHKAGAWALLTMAAPAGATASSLYRVTCASMTLCYTVGEYVNSSGETLMLIEKN